MTRPDNLFEAASYDLVKFRERRLSDRRAQPRNGPDRRAAPHDYSKAPASENTAADSGKDADETGLQ